ncbi:MAG: polyprenyl synthetase family protein [Bacteroidetes bacterium QS_8_68_28]|nr:MAG: polyprenyl synthetase family protein [Bacteroidetes bacterium QS_8_68_28]
MPEPAALRRDSACEADSSAAPENRVQHLRERVNNALAELELREEPALLYDPVRYVLGGDGKRLRPVLLLLAAEVFGAETEDALPAALAVEAFHNFTLVHDDVMDHAEERRGRPAVHRRWDTGTALLAGDLLLVRAYDLLAEAAAGAETDLAALMRPFRRMARRLCEGQALDKTFETREAVSVEEYLDMIDGKTGALLSATLELGGLCGDTAPARAEALRNAGAALGRAFQIQDDLLDLTADSERWGKPVGGDLREGKKTFLLVRARERAAEDDAEDARALFERAAESGLASGEIDEARRRMARLGVLSDARRAVARYTEAATAHLDRALPSETGDPEDGRAEDARARGAAGTLRWLIGKMQARLH